MAVGKPCLAQDRALRSLQLDYDRLEVMALVKIGCEHAALRGREHRLKRGSSSEITSSKHSTLRGKM